MCYALLLLLSICLCYSCDSPRENLKQEWYLHHTIEEGTVSFVGHEPVFFWVFEQDSCYKISAHANEWPLWRPNRQPYQYLDEDNDWHQLLLPPPAFAIGNWPETKDTIPVRVYPDSLLYQEDDSTLKVYYKVPNFEQGQNLGQARALLQEQKAFVFHTPEGDTVYTEFLPDQKVITPVWFGEMATHRHYLSRYKEELFLTWFRQDWNFYSYQIVEMGDAYLDLWDAKNSQVLRMQAREEVSYNNNKAAALMGYWQEMTQQEINQHPLLAPTVPTPPLPPAPPVEERLKLDIQADSLWGYLADTVYQAPFYLTKSASYCYAFDCFTKHGKAHLWKVNLLDKDLLKVEYSKHKPSRKALFEVEEVYFRRVERVGNLLE